MTLGLISPLDLQLELGARAVVAAWMLSTQNGLDIDRQPWVLSFWYMYFV